MNVLIAIDPGASGGICVLSGTQLRVYPTPSTPRETCDIFENALEDSLSIRCYVERVGGYVGPSFDREGMEGGQPASRAFQFGCNFGVLLGILTALKIPFELVTPQTWIKGLGLGTKGLLKPELNASMGKPERIAEIKRVNSINNKLKTAWKNKLKEVAQRLYPREHITLKTSDALLILEWARRRENAPMAVAPEPPQKEMAL